MDCGIVLSYFSPCGYKTLRQHVAKVLNTVVATGAPVSFSQVVRPGQQPVIPPSSVYAHQIFESSDTMFFKENLWNLAAQELSTKNLIFLDADVYYKDPSWLEKIAAALSRADVIQPYDNAHWHEANGEISRVVPCCFRGILLNESCPGGEGVSLGTHHPGFGFALTRDAFDRLGGFYELSVAGGGGDTSFVLSFSDTERDRAYLHGRREDWSMCFSTPTFVAYRENALKQKLKIGYVPGLDIFHMWHGSRPARQYTTRHLYFDGYTVNDDPPCTKRADGLLYWTLPQPRAIDYFISRNEDVVAVCARRFKPV